MAATAYTITDLGILPGSESGEARALTADGQIVGSCLAQGPDNFGRATMWTASSITDLGALLGAMQAGAEAINVRGQVVGWSAYRLAPFSRATLWSLADGEMTDLSLSGDMQDLSGSSAYGLNNHDRIVGYADTSGGARHAAVWESGELHLLLPLPGDATSSASAIDDRGIDVGSSRRITTSGDIQQLACRWLPRDARSTSPSPYPDREGVSLGTLSGGAQSEARSINDAGQIAGAATTADGVARAVLWDADGIHDLGVFPGASHSWANAINDAGQIVGSSSAGSGPTRWEHAILWEDGDIIDLGTFPGGGASVATAINNAGQIVGAAWTAAGARHAALWTPSG
jgi:probable HAF family extracellular repeat protein